MQEQSRVEVLVGLTEVEITDFNIRKLIETMVVDWPNSPQ